MRNYKDIEHYLNILIGDVYEQPPCEGHGQATRDVVNMWLPNIRNGRDDRLEILDVGCAQGQMFEMLAEYGNVTGVTLGSDWTIANKKYPGKVENADFSFLPFDDGRFDIVFARHAIEHSPIPLLTLMEWRRVSKQFLLMVAPDPDYIGYAGQNHYYVLHKGQWINLLERSGWHPIWIHESTDPVAEIRFMCEKKHDRA